MENSSNTSAKQQEAIEQQIQNWPQKSWEIMSRLRKTNPLIQCITNYVSIDIMANTLLAAGASPAMVSSSEEIPEFTPQVHPLCINAMKLATQLAVQHRKPWVLDPVATGSSGFRLRACLDLLALKPTVVRGNASEIIALASASLDSLHESLDALEAGKSLAQASGAVVAVSGDVDIVTDGNQVIGAHNGVPIMQQITATGCSVTALIAAFVAVEPTHALEATVSALSIFGIVGELGMESEKGPASLRVNLIDSLYGLDEGTVDHRVKVSSLFRS
ncbi:hypothetical protein RND81_12G054100 [Saponaria officinalis]|uniref:hydroxyethylthiazole kinase n=1 Tax=Saponaria officinalis TaxID=3572 RepID=A0AAW1H563_SAPOF